MKSMNDFVAVNGIYAKYFGDHKPARSAVEVARLPKDVLVEVERDLGGHSGDGQIGDGHEVSLVKPPVVPSDLVIVKEPAPSRS